MTLRYRGEVRVNADKPTVWDFVTDVRRIARCLPDSVHIADVDDRRFQASVPVDVGPLRGKVRVEAELTPDRAADRLNLVIVAGGFGGSGALTAIADFTQQADGTTLVNWHGEAVARGAVAMMAGRKKIDEQARKMLAYAFSFLKRNVAAVPSPS